MGIENMQQDGHHWYASMFTSAANITLSDPMRWSHLNRGDLNRGVLTEEVPVTAGDLQAAI